MVEDKEETKVVSDVGGVGGKVNEVLGGVNVPGLGNLESLLDFLKRLDFKKHFVGLDVSSLLFKGYVRSGEVRIMEGLRAEFRTLLVNEWVRCKEVAGSYKDPDASHFAFMVEYLVYALITVNGVQLVMDPHEVQEFRSKHGREPTMEEQTRYVLLNCFPPFFVEVLWLVAWKFKQDFDTVFMEKLLKEFKELDEEVKKIGVVGK